jgi:alanine racemase
MTANARQVEALLTANLDAVVSNWRLLGAAAGRAECAAVVKADAYGLGAVQVSTALEAAGCRTFFVAHSGEGLELRRALQPASRVFVLNGVPAGMECQLADAALTPVVNTLGDLAAWRSCAAARGKRLAIALQLDTGMARLGLAPQDVELIAADDSLLHGLSVQLVMSHLACADEKEHPANEAQRGEFERLRALLPDAPASLANSSGTFLGKGFHFDLLRPGAALYGINPTPWSANPMRQTLSLRARVIQTRRVRAGTPVGYGHRSVAARDATLATISLGYADGWPRNAGTFAFHLGQPMPFLGRVSMDTIVLDMTDLTHMPREGDLIDIICPQQTVDDIAGASGTIAYEILTRFGRRFHRIYVYSGDARLDDRAKSP